MEGTANYNNSVTKYEREMVNMLQKMNEDMAGFAETDLMSEHAYNELGMLQKKQMDQIRKMFGHIQKLIGSEYFSKRCGSVDAPLRKKRQTEAEKRADCITNPERYHICPCCDSIFGSKFNLDRHRSKTLKCGIIKCSKKGALDVGFHRAPTHINRYIRDHMADADSDDEVQDQIDADETAFVAQEVAAHQHMNGTGETDFTTEEVTQYVQEAFDIIPNTSAPLTAAEEEQVDNLAEQQFDSLLANSNLGEVLLDASNEHLNL
jgi:hypothetical protein